MNNILRVKSKINNNNNMLYLIKSHLFLSVLQVDFQIKNESPFLLNDLKLSK